ncbi:MAG: TIGR03773 family transporter-associated surface protein, partial [Bifidobacteriaceae bacterium]|nr:TIGR03773 family transporter-associated surface protein [Bifidobacteriaceae bacterium]
AWAHKHTSWDFTAPGVYCLTMGMSARLADGTPVADTGVFTVVVGGDLIDPTSMRTCEQLGVAPAVGVPAAVPPQRVTDPSAPVVVDLRYTPERTVSSSLATTIDESGRLRVDYVVEGQTGGGTAYDPDDVVLQVTSTSRFAWDASKLSSSQLTGDLDWRLMSVTGGSLEMADDYSSLTGIPVFSTEAAKDAHTIWPGTKILPTWTLGSSGVTCATFEWSGVAADGSPLGPVLKTLTFAGPEVDPAAVIPCSWEGGEPGDGDGDVDPGEELPTDWSQLPVSGRHVLDGGHVDLRSTLTDAQHVIAVHDDNTSPATTRAVDDVTFSVPALAKQVVPGGDAYAFLGSEGAPVWLLPQTPQAGLVWPGWSLEIGAGSTATAVRWSLEGVRGPGEFALYENLDFGAVGVRLDSDDPAHSVFDFDQHGHANWAFSAEGVYCVDLAVSPVPAEDGLDRPVTLLFGVGDVDPERVNVDQCGKTPAQITGTESPGDGGDEDQGNGGDEPGDGGGGEDPGDGGGGGEDGPGDGEVPGDGGDDDAGNGGEDPGDEGDGGEDGPGDGEVPGDGGDEDQGNGGDDPGDGGDDDDDDPGEGGGEDPAPEVDAVWDVANGTVNQAGATVLNNGHVDIASLLNGASLATRVKDTTRSADPTWRDPAKTVLQLLPGSRATVPSASQWAFLGAPGAPLWQVTQTAQDSLLWPGWSTEPIAADATRTGVDWTLTGVSGPGEFALYQTGSFGQPTVLFNTSDGITAADRFTIPKLTHAHGSWAFSAEGNYCLAFERSTTLASGNNVSDSFTLAVAIGHADVMRIDPATCFQAPGEQLPQDQTTAPSTRPVSTPSADAVPAKTQVPATKCTAGATILSAGHIDYATRIVGGELESLIGDDTSGTKVYREPAGTILWLKPSSQVTLPSGYGSVGSAGSRVWQVPQTQNMDLIWLGWSTESLNAGNTRGPVTWTINRVDGPGSMKVYLSGPFGGVQQMVFNNGGSYQVPLGVHAHANWAFSAEGIYRIGMTQTATLAGGQISSDAETLTIVVGDVDPTTAAAAGSGCGTVSNAVLAADDVDGALQAAEQAAADAAPAAREVLPGQGSDADADLGDPLTGPFDDPFTALTEGDPGPLLLVLAVLLLVGAAGSGARWWRLRRRGAVS